MNRWRGKVALVTGASSGIGAEIAKLLVKNGVNVVGIARNMEKLEKIGEEIGKDKYFPIKCDIMKEEDILNVFEWVEKKFKGIDILVNNAAILHTGFFIGKYSYRSIIRFFEYDRNDYIIIYYIYYYIILFYIIFYIILLYILSLPLKLINHSD